jgi:hypothetical protein
MFFVLSLGMPVCEQVWKQEGFCNLEIPSWSFDAESEMCEEFHYSGCGGNKNRFNSQMDCLDKCVRGKIIYFYGNIFPR